MVSLVSLVSAPAPPAVWLWALARALSSDGETVMYNITRHGHDTQYTTRHARGRQLTAHMTEIRSTTTGQPAAPSVRWNLATSDNLIATTGCAPEVGDVDSWLLWSLPRSGVSQQCGQHPRHGRTPASQTHVGTADYSAPAEAMIRQHISIPLRSEARSCEANGYLQRELSKRTRMRHVRVAGWITVPPCHHHTATVPPPCHHRATAVCRAPQQPVLPVHRSTPPL